MGENSKTFKTKVVFKHETEANWALSNYVPMQGEKVLVDPDDTYKYTRVKYGDGDKAVKDLPYSLDGANWEQTDEKEINFIKNKPPIQKGSGTGSVEIGEGNATGSYSISGGSTNKDAISGIIGELASASVSVNAPKSLGAGSLSIGAGTEAISAGSNAIGVMNTTGVKGCYWESVGALTSELNSRWGFDASLIGKPYLVLSNSRTIVQENYILGQESFQKDIDANSLTIIDDNNDGKFDWGIGDTISLVNGSNKYAAISTIRAIGSKEVSYTALCGFINAANITKTAIRVVIIVDSLPFSIRESVTLTTPDDFTIFACYQKEEVNYLNKIVNKRWYPRPGIIELGWAGTAFGIENLTTGSGAMSTGWNNWSAGDFGFTSGRDNISGYAAQATGSGTKATGDYASSEGRLTEAIGLATHAEGMGSKAIGDYSHAGGVESEAHGAASSATNYKTRAMKDYAFATGAFSGALSEAATAFGRECIAGGEGAYNGSTGKWEITEYGSGKYAIAGGYKSKANGYGAIALGVGGNSLYYYNSTTNEEKTLPSGAFTRGAVSLGEGCRASGDFAIASGHMTQAFGPASQAHGYKSIATKQYSQALGSFCAATGESSFAFGRDCVAGTDVEYKDSRWVLNNDVIDSEKKIDSYAIAGGYNSKALGEGAIALGKNSIAFGANSLAMIGGQATSDSIAIGGEAQMPGAIAIKGIAGDENTIAIGVDSLVSGTCGVAIGTGSWASGYAVALGGGQAAAGGSFAVGSGATSGEGAVALPGGTASGAYSLAAGYGTVAKGIGSAIFGKNNTGDHQALANYSFVTGSGCVVEASSTCGVALGRDHKVSGPYSMAVGWGNIIPSDCQNVFVAGKYANVTTNTAFAIGNGVAGDPKNVFTVNKDNSVTLGNTTITESKLKDLIDGTSMKDYVDTQLGNIAEALQAILDLQNSYLPPIELEWIEYPFVNGVASIDNASESFSSGTYKVKTNMGEADNTWHCDLSEDEFTDTISFANGIESVTVYRKRNQELNIDIIEFTANFPAFSLYLAKID